MKIQLKKVDIPSLIFSGFSVTLFFVSLFIAVVSIFIVPNPIWIGESVRAKIIGAFFYTLTVYIITLAYLTFLIFIYNFLVSVIGIRGIRLVIEEETDGGN